MKKEKPENLFRARRSIFSQAYSSRLKRVNNLNGTMEEGTSPEVSSGDRVRLQGVIRVSKTKLTGRRLLEAQSSRVVVVGGGEFFYGLCISILSSGKNRKRKLLIFQFFQPFPSDFSFYTGCVEYIHTYIHIYIYTHTERHCSFSRLQFSSSCGNFFSR